jgi:hypothetical protein
LPICDCRLNNWLPSPRITRPQGRPYGTDYTGYTKNLRVGPPPGSPFPVPESTDYTDCTDYTYWTAHCVGGPEADCDWRIRPKGLG